MKRTVLTKQYLLDLIQYLRLFLPHSLVQKRLLLLRLQEGLLLLLVDVARAAARRLLGVVESMRLSCQGKVPPFINLIAWQIKTFFIWSLP